MLKTKQLFPHTTIRRIVALKGNPQPETAIKIFNSLGEDQLLYKYMPEFHPDIAKVMTINFSHNQDFKFVNEVDREYFTSEDYFLILNLATPSLVRPKMKSCMNWVLEVLKDWPNLLARA